MRHRTFAVGCLLALSGPAAGADITRQSYLCARDVIVPAIYVSGDVNPAVAVILVEGQLVALQATPAASGSRYGGGQGAEGYIWWTHGDTATLLWRDPGADAEEIILPDCAAVPPEKQN